MSAAGVAVRAPGARPPASGLAGRAPAVGVAPSVAVEQVLLAAILAFGFVVRAMLALMMTPWQAPDEPKHFEYIRVLIDQRATFWSERRLPTIGDAEPELQREIIASLARYHYWGAAPSSPPSPLPTRFADIWPDGTDTQLHRPSLYYYL